jgi:preprotein translocase subunit SecG
VFGARGASNFLSKSTKWLAIVFFGISLFMAWQASHSARPAVQQNLGIMAEQPAAPAAAGELSKPAQSPSTVPSAPITVPGATPSTVPSAPASSVPVESVPVEKETAPATPAQAPATPPQGG